MPLRGHPGTIAAEVTQRKRAVPLLRSRLATGRHFACFQGSSNTDLFVPKATVDVRSGGRRATIPAPHRGDPSRDLKITDSNGKMQTATKCLNVRGGIDVRDRWQRSSTTRPKPA
jgi:hypothetical protein